MLLFCGGVGFGIPALLGVVGGSPWWLPAVPITAILIACSGAPDATKGADDDSTSLTSR